MTTCELPVSPGEGGLGACTGLVSGVASCRSPMLHRTQPSRSTSPDRVDHEALLSLGNPLNYVPPGGDRAAQWDEEEDVERAAKSGPEVPRTRFIESRAEEVLEDTWQPPRVRVPAARRSGAPSPVAPDVASADGPVADGKESSSAAIPRSPTLRACHTVEQTATKVVKSVRWSEHICSVAIIECISRETSRETSPVESGGDVLFGRPRLPRRDMDNFAPSGTFTRRQMMAQYAPVNAPVPRRCNPTDVPEQHVPRLPAASAPARPAHAAAADADSDRPNIRQPQSRSGEVAGDAMLREQMMAQYAPAARPAHTAPAVLAMYAPMPPQSCKSGPPGPPEPRPPRLPGTSAASARPAQTAASDADEDSDRPRPRLPRGAAGLLRGSIVPCTSRRSKGTNYMELLGEVGLLQSVWPAECVIMGLCVSKNLKSELVSCPSVVITLRPGGNIPTDLVLETLTGAIAVWTASAQERVPSPKPSESTRSIKSFMKMLSDLSEDDQGQAGRGALAPAQSTPGGGLLPLVITLISNLYWRDAKTLNPKP